MYEKKTIPVMVNDGIIEMYHTSSIPVMAMVGYQEMLREYGDNIPVGETLRFVERCLVHKKDAAVVEAMTMEEFAELVSEWMRISALETSL